MSGSGASPFAGNVAFVLPHAGLAVVAAVGCGTRELRRVAQQQSRDLPAVVPVPALPALRFMCRGLRVAALWRDPVARLAHVRSRWVAGDIDYARWVGIQEHTDWSRFVDFVELELGKRDPLRMHPTLRPQHTVWPSRLDQVLNHDDLGGLLGRHPCESHLPLPPDEVCRRVRDLYRVDAESAPLR